MIVKAGDQIINADSIIKEGDIIVVLINGGISDEQLKALQSGMLDIDNGYAVYSGFTELTEHNVFLRKPNTDEIADMKAALEALGVKKETSWTAAAEQIVKTQ